MDENGIRWTIYKFVNVMICKLINSFVNLFFFATLWQKYKPRNSQQLITRNSNLT